ncbi:MAG: flap endonuclease-1 [archaeon]
MGVKIGDFIPKKQLNWDDLKGKILAVDSSNMLYQFLSSIRQQDGTPLMDQNENITSHLVGLFSRVPNLLEKGIKLVFVFDGKPPELKYQEQGARRDRKEKAAEKYADAVDEEDVESMLKYSKQTTRLTKEMNEEAKELLTAMGLPVVQAPSEADAQMAYMNKQGDVWACATTDFDPLLHRAPRVVRNLTLSQKKRMPSGGYAPVFPELLELKEILNKLEIDNDQLLILSILIGTDYNPGGVKGIGPAKALKLIQSDKKFEEIFKELDVNFDWKQIAETFKKMPVEKDYKVEFKEMDEEKIKELLLKRGFAEERINKTLDRLKTIGKDKVQKDLKKWF